MNQSRVPSLNEEVQPTSSKSLQKRDYKGWEKAYIWKGRLRIVQNESSQVNNNQASHHVQDILRVPGK